MLAISVGTSGIKNRGLVDCDPSEACKSLFETFTIGISATVITKSLWPVLIPMAYIVYENAWYKSDVPARINESVNDGR